ISTTHLQNLTEIFVKYNVYERLRVHLIHGHTKVVAGNVILGHSFIEPSGRWAKLIRIEEVNLADIYGHIFKLVDGGRFIAYEYIKGKASPLPDLFEVNSTFLLELAEYLITNNLLKLIGLQVIDPNPIYILELILPQRTIILDVSSTGWKFESKDSKLYIYQANKTYGQYTNGHDIYNKGSPYPKLETFEDIKNILIEVGILD
ncbi:uncharacterized protein K444DRAFT_528535, partial [Hyaloscypha bicolor E]